MIESFRTILIRTCLRLGCGFGIIVALMADDLPLHLSNMVIPPRSIAERPAPENVVTPWVIKPRAPENYVVPPARSSRTVEQIAKDHALPPELVRSIIKVESNYNPKAISPKGARGLMQLIPSTARRFGVSNALNEVDNVEGGARYLRYLLDLYDGDYPLALAAYNAGEGAVFRYGGVPPYRETQNYVVQVLKELQRTRSATTPQIQGAPR